MQHDARAVRAAAAVVAHPHKAAKVLADAEDQRIGAARVRVALLDRRGHLPPTLDRHGGVAFGDVHGDLDATRRALKLAGAIDANEHAGTRDLDGIINDLALLERLERSFDLAQALIDLVGQFIGFRIFRLEPVVLLAQRLASGALVVGACWWPFAGLWLAHYSFGEALRKRYLSLKTIAGLLSVVPAWSAAVLLHADEPQGRQWVMFTVVLVWCADVFAYFAGRAFGRTKIAPRISPGKTRAGAEWLLQGPRLEAGFVLLALPVGLLAWVRLRALARGYEAKRFSDAQLLARTWWLLLVALDAIELISARGAGVAVPVFAVSALSVGLYGPLLGLALKRAVAGPRPPPRTLLVLRVFGDTARSQALFDRLVARWRWFGPVTLIAAPDVLARTVDPGDFLRFAAGDIASSFVGTQADLQRRLAALDTAPDPDGRYRINDFCCRDASWQATVVPLIERADAVVMDLRAYGPQRAGCRFELGELRRRRRPEQVVLLVDASTDRTLLEPLPGEGGAPLPLVELRHHGGAAFDEAFARLLRAAA